MQAVNKSYLAAFSGRCHWCWVTLLPQQSELMILFWSSGVNCYLNNLPSILRGERELLFCAKNLYLKCENIPNLCGMRTFQSYIYIYIYITGKFIISNLAFMYIQTCGRQICYCNYQVYFCACYISFSTGNLCYFNVMRLKVCTLKGGCQPNS